MIYFDNAATTFPKPEPVYKAVDFAMRNLAVNIGRGSFNVATEAMGIVDETRGLLAALTGITKPQHVIFTPSATIAANEIILGLDWDEFKTVYVSPFEHNAIIRPLHRVCERYGIEMIVLPYDPITNSINLEKTEISFSAKKPDYVFLNHVSNVTGIISPVETVCALAKEYEAICVVDGSQSLGLVEINLNKANIDYLIFAGHKNLYSIFGVGGFICKDKPAISPALYGGTGSNSLDMSMGDVVPVKFEPASPNIIAIASLNASLKWINEITIPCIQARKKALSERLIQGLQTIGCKVYVPSNLENHTSVVSFNVNDYFPNEVGDILNHDYDIAVRTGYHCAPYIHSVIGSIDQKGTVRASLSYFNSEEDVDRLVSAISEL